MKIDIFKIVVGIVIVAAAMGVLFLGAQIFVFTPDLGEKTVRIERGMDVFDIADLLKSQEIIQNRFGFVAYITLTGNLNNLQAGEYSFDGEYAIYQVADIVSSGLSLSSQKNLFIPEGFTLKQIDAALVGAGIEPIGEIADFKISDFEQDFPFLAQAPGHIESLEGYLFPDTYRFEKRSPANVIVRKILANFEEKTFKLRQDSDKQGKDFYEVLILASILEREIPPKDMTRAAGVLSKRLEAAMALQTDATLVYILGRPIERSDIDMLNSPYNSYQNRGLPPTPIANPGLVSLDAALNPEQNNYWYYLSRRDNGQTIFSRTFAEHDAARAKYLR